MLPGLPIVRRCPVCSELIQQGSFVSGNTIYAAWWSDGSVIGPMMPESLVLAVCASCGVRLWVQELPILARDYQGKLLRAAGIDDLSEELKSRGLDRDKTLWLRIQLWWRTNELRRVPWMGEKPLPKLTEEEVCDLQAFEAGGDGRTLGQWVLLRNWCRSEDHVRLLREGRVPEPDTDNLRSLEDLLDPGDEWEGLLRAEISRELGEFDVALSRLGALGEVNERHAYLFKAIRHLAQSGDSQVVRIA